MPSQGTLIPILTVNNLLTQNKKIKDTSTTIINDAIKKHEAEFDKLEADTRNTSDKDFTEHIFDKAQSHFKDSNNIYIFSKDVIDGLFSKGATHLMIIKGSQMIAEHGFQMGQPTLIIAGCTDAGRYDQQGEIYETIKPIDKLPALEHPPFRYDNVVKFTKDDDSITVSKQI